jgi:hypothetical protein
MIRALGSIGILLLMLLSSRVQNKMARVVWALLVKGGVYRAPAATA